MLFESELFEACVRSDISVHTEVDQIAVIEHACVWRYINYRNSFIGVTLTDLIIWKDQRWHVYL